MSSDDTATLNLDKPSGARRSSGRGRLEVNCYPRVEGSCPRPLHICDRDASVGLVKLCVANGLAVSKAARERRTLAAEIPRDNDWIEKSVAIPV